MFDFTANYLDLWREHARSRNETGEVPISKLAHIVFSECNPTRELLDALIAVKQDGKSNNLQFYCKSFLAQYLPRQKHKHWRH